MSLDSTEGTLASKAEIFAETKSAAMGIVFCKDSEQQNYYSKKNAPTVLLLADDASVFQQELSRAMRDNGLLQQSPQDATCVTGSAGQLPDVVLSLSTGDRTTIEHHRDAERLAAKDSIVWMPVARMNARYLFVGPLLSVYSYPCYACLWTCGSAWLQNCIRSQEQATIPEQVQAAFAASVICDAVAGNLARAARTSSTAGEGSLSIYDLSTLSSHNALVGRIPGCPSCWPAEGFDISGNNREFSLPALFEECSRSRVGEGSIQGIPLSRQLAKNPLASNPRAYPQSRKVPLPARSTFYRDRNQAPKGELRLQELAELLFSTFGRWNRADAKRPDRMLPSAGNLGSPGAFLIVRDVVGLEPGVYFYLEASHELARIDSFAIGTVEDLLEGFWTGFPAALPGALLIMTGSYSRIAVKYGAFGFRLTHFDSGLFLAHLRMVARSLSLTIHAVSSWPESMLAQRLAIDTEQCPITAAVGFSSLDLLPPPSVPSLDAAERVPGDEPSLPFYCEEHDPLGLARHIHQMSLRELPPDWSGVCIRTEAGSFEDSWTEAHFAYSRSELWNQMVTRRSLREFTDKSVNAAIITPILRAVRDSAQRRSAVPLVSILATLRSGPPSRPVWHTYGLSSEDGLVTCGAAGRTGSLDALFVHPDAAKAALLFWFCGDVRQTAWHYRRMLLEAGEHAYTLTQEASCFGLHGYLVGGIWPQRVASTLGLRFCDKSPLLAFACGFSQAAYEGE